MKEILEDKKEVSFEEALSRLEEVVRRLESSEMALDEALSLFQEGISLSRTCHRKLDEAEKKIERVISDGQRLKTIPAPELEQD